MNTAIHGTKAVLVTGSSRGIGKGIARAFAGAGYAVAVNYLKEKEKAAAVKEEIEAAGGRAALFPADVADPAQAAALVDAVIKEFGRLDVLAHNAAINRDRSILKMSDDEWDDVLRTDLTGSFQVLRACGKAMVRQKGGSIIVLASIAGIRGAYGAANYASAKAGLMGLARSAARELGRFNVRVNAVLPGFHLTDMGQSVSERYRQKALEESVLGCSTDLGELGRFVVLLAELTTVSGQIFNIDSRIV